MAYNKVMFDPDINPFPIKHDRKWSTIFYHIIHHSVCPEPWTEILLDIKFDDPSARRAWSSTNQRCKWVNDIFRGQNICQNNRRTSKSYTSPDVHTCSLVWWMSYPRSTVQPQWIIVHYPTFEKHGATVHNCSIWTSKWHHQSISTT